MELKCLIVTRNRKMWCPDTSFLEVWEETNTHYYIDGAENIRLYNRYVPYSESSLKRWAKGEIKMLPYSAEYIQAEIDFLAKKEVYLPEKGEIYQGRYLELLKMKSVSFKGAKRDEYDDHLWIVDEGDDVFYEITEYSCEISQEELISILNDTNKKSLRGNR